METDIEVVNARDGTSLRVDMSDDCTVDSVRKIVEEYWGERAGTYLLRNGTDIISDDIPLVGGETYYVVPMPLVSR